MTGPIRACVMDDDFQRVFTWYYDGMVLFHRRDMELRETFAGIYNWSQFNALLREMNIAPIGSKETLKGQRGREAKELAKIPF